MDTSWGEPATRTVQIRVTRTPNRRRRRRRLLGRSGSDLGAEGLFEGASMLDDGLGVLAPIALLLLILGVGLFVVPALLTLVVGVGELVLVGTLGLSGSLWAWIRRHPRVAVLTLDGERWQREIEPGWNGDEDARVVADGVAPEAIGYRPSR